MEKQELIALLEELYELLSESTDSNSYKAWEKIEGTLVKLKKDD